MLDQTTKLYYILGKYHHSAEDHFMVPRLCPVVAEHNKILLMISHVINQIS